VTTETITDYETVERTTEMAVCDLCGCNEDDTPEMMELTANFHICVACVVEYDGTVDHYEAINVTESISGILYIKPQTVTKPDVVDIIYYLVVTVVVITPTSLVLSAVVSI